MAVSKESSKAGATNKVDRELRKAKREVPLMERSFDELVTLKDQFEWIRRKRSENDQAFLKDKG